MKEIEESGGIIAGRNAVTEALLAGREIETIFMLPGEKGGAPGRVRALARERGVVVKDADPSKLDRLAWGQAHQGVVAIAAAYVYSDVEDIFARVAQKGQPPFIIIADEIQDPHNLGAIIRAAEAAGAHGLIIPKRRSAAVNTTVLKSSSGAAEHLPVARVTNLVSEIEKLKERGVWVFAAEAGGQSWTAADLTGAVALVIGSEGFGVGRLIKQSCDGIISLPMNGCVNSLNASVAAGILMYEVVRQRMKG